jgi:hypothetical protein
MEDTDYIRNSTAPKNQKANLCTPQRQEKYLRVLPRTAVVAFFNEICANRPNANFHNFMVN